MDLRLQAKLLRAIQEKEIDRLGGHQPVKVDVRILATSNRNLEEVVRAGTFREDLYFRLNVVGLKLPPLRDRPADIELLSEHFAKKFAELNAVPVRPIAPEAKKMLFSHSWRGNVRELENAVHRAVLLATGAEIGPDAVMLSDANSLGGRDGSVAAAMAAAQAGTKGLVGRAMADVERELIIDTLLHCLGNRTHAANILGISIRTLRNKLRQYSQEGFGVPSPGEAERPSL